MKKTFTILFLFALCVVMPPGVHANQTQKQAFAHFQPEKEVIQQAVALEAWEYQTVQIATYNIPAPEFVAELPQPPKKLKPYVCYIDVSSQAQNYNLITLNSQNKHTRGSDKADAYKERVRSDTRA